MTLGALRWSLLGVLSVSGCADTGQERLALQLAVRGAESASLEVNGASFLLTRAQVAVGPLYFCASADADTEQCEAALAELTEVVSIDGLAPETSTGLELQGTTGEVRSALYDYGISWLLTQSAPEPVAAAQHSALLEGTLTKDGRELRFVANVDVLPNIAGANAVHGQRTRHQLQAGDKLTLAVDPTQWLRPVDVDALFALDSEGSGKVSIERGSQAYEAILQGMQNRAPVQFEWK